MDLSKLNSNEKIAAVGAVVAILGSIVGFGAGPYGLITGIAMLAIIFLPQFSPGTNLPGSKGSLMLVVGGAAGIGAVLTLLAWLPYLGIMGGYFIGGLLGIVGGLLMGWGGWQEFQSEGGKFQLGSSSGAAAAPPPASSEPAKSEPAQTTYEAPPAPSEPPRDVYEAPAAPTTPEAPAERDPEDRPTP
jgi:hypothetical protein